MPELLVAFLDWLRAYRLALTAPRGPDACRDRRRLGPADGRHAVTQSLVASGVAGQRLHDAFHRVCWRSTWRPDRRGRWLCAHVRWAVDLDRHGRRVVSDDTVAAKQGPQGFGIGSHLDAVRSTPRFQVT